MKHCERCNKSKPLSAFVDRSLRSGVGLVCTSCKGSSGKRKYRNKRHKPSSKDRAKFSQSKVKFKFKVGGEYEISYVNMYGTASQRTIKVKDLDDKYIKAFDSRHQKIITFKKDRVQKSKEV